MIAVLKTGYDWQLSPAKQRLQSVLYDIASVATKRIAALAQDDLARLVEQHGVLGIEVTPEIAQEWLVSIKKQYEKEVRAQFAAQVL